MSDSSDGKHILARRIVLYKLVIFPYIILLEGRKI